MSSSSVYTGYCAPGTPCVHYQQQQQYQRMRVYQFESMDIAGWESMSDRQRMDVMTYETQLPWPCPNLARLPIPTLQKIDSLGGAVVPSITVTHFYLQVQAAPEVDPRISFVRQVAQSLKDEGASCATAPVVRRLRHDRDDSTTKKSSGQLVLARTNLDNDGPVVIQSLGTAGAGTGAGAGVPHAAIPLTSQPVFATPESKRRAAAVLSGTHSRGRTPLDRLKTIARAVGKAQTRFKLGRRDRQDNATLDLIDSALEAEQANEDLIRELSKRSDAAEIRNALGVLNAIVM